MTRDGDPGGNNQNCSHILELQKLQTKSFSVFEAIRGAAAKAYFNSFPLFIWTL